MRKAKVYYSCSLLYHVIVIRIESVVRYESFPRGGKKPPPLRAREQQMHHYNSQMTTLSRPKLFWHQDDIKSKEPVCIDKCRSALTYPWLDSSSLCASPIFLLCIFRTMLSSLKTDSLSKGCLFLPGWLFFAPPLRFIAKRGVWRQPKNKNPSKPQNN